MLLFSLLSLLLPAALAQPPALPHRLHLDALGQAAPEFTLENEQGKQTRFSELRDRPVILHFWASWCTSCARELPQLAALAERSASAKVRFLAISVDSPGDGARAREFLKKSGAPVPFWQVSDPKAARSYWAWGLPVTYFVEPQGRIAARALGPRDWPSVTVGELLSLFQKR